MDKTIVTSTAVLLEAIYFAATAHGSQSRKGNGGEPYINHLIEVVILLSTVGKVTDTDTLIAAVLHDSLEDTSVTAADILDKFGEQVLLYIEALTDDKTLSLSERRAMQLAHIATACQQVKLIKLGDHISNIGSLPTSWDKGRLEDYIAWSYKVAKACFTSSSELAYGYEHRYKQALYDITLLVK